MPKKRQQKMGRRPIATFEPNFGMRIEPAAQIDYQR
jgi:hypothetical protein